MKSERLKSFDIEKVNLVEDYNFIKKSFSWKQKTDKRYRRKNQLNRLKVLFSISLTLYFCMESTLIPLKYPLSFKIPMIRVEGYTMSKWNTRSMLGFGSSKCDLPHLPPMFSKRSINQLSYSKNNRFHHKQHLIYMKKFAHYESTKKSAFSQISSFHKTHNKLMMQSIKQVTHDEPSSVVMSSSKTKKDSTGSYWEHLFSVQLPEGYCVAMRLNLTLNDDDNHSNQHKFNDDFWINLFGPSSSMPLHPDEIKYGISLPNLRQAARTSFFIGRLSIRSALNAFLENQKDTDFSILKDEHGRPKMPNGYLGSISHKRNTGVALVGIDSSQNNKGQRKGIGVDIEQSFSRRLNVAKRVLTSHELSELGNIEGVSKDEEVLLRFSLKESVYKAMHPLLCQFVGFQEAEITPHADGTATVTLNLNNGAHKLLSEKDTTAHWRRVEGGFFLTSASVMLKNETD